MTKPRPAVWLLGAPVLLGSFLTTSCTGPDTETPVPDVAAPPYACPGVPQQAFFLITGVDAESDPSTTTSGEWGGSESNFNCQIKAEKGSADGRAGVTVVEQDLAVAGTSEEALLDENDSHLVIEADAPGAGVAYQSTDLALARWVCDDRFLSVQVVGVVEGRDGAQDVANYLVSMLPWACGGEAVPEEGQNG